MLMILSLFEGRDDIRNVILYGVPGLPSLSLPESATYSEIRSMIVREVPNFSEFYFVANGKVIKIEDNVIDWGFGHLVLNVHTSRDLPGGSKRVNSDDESKGRKCNKPCDLQRLLLTDASGDEGSDNLRLFIVSESESIQEND